MVAIIEIFSDQEPEEAALGYPKLRAKLQVCLLGVPLLLHPQDGAAWGS